MCSFTDVFSETFRQTISSDNSFDSTIFLSVSLRFLLFFIYLKDHLQVDYWRHSVMYL